MRLKLGIPHALVFGIACALAAPTAAQTWPARPVRIIVPFAPGGGVDTVTGTQRFMELPAVPTIAESGVPGYNVTGWYGFYAPAAMRNIENVNSGHRPPLIDRLERRA